MFKVNNDNMFYFYDLRNFSPSFIFESEKKKNKKKRKNDVFTCIQLIRF